LVTLAKYVRDRSQRTGKTVRLRLQGSVDAAPCTGSCGENVEEGRIASPVAAAWVARARAAAVAMELRSALPDVVVEESGGFDLFEEAGPPFRRVSVEVTAGRPDAGECDGMCDLLGREVLPRLERFPPRAAFEVSTGSAFLAGAWLGTVQAGFGVLHEDVTFLALIGGVAGPGETRAGYVLRGQVFFPSLLDSKRRFYVGTGAAAVLTGEGLSTEPQPTRQHYLGELLAGADLWKGEHLALSLELGALMGLERRTVSSISGTRVVPLVENRLAIGGELGVSIMFY
jgi:hypothetical protein